MSQQLTNTLSNLETRVRRWVREETAASSQWSSDFIRQLINVNYFYRVSELQMAFEGYFTITGDRDLIANQGRYSWPPGFVRLLKLEIVRSDGRRIPIQREERHFHVIAPAGNTGGDDYLPTYRPVGSGFVLEPVSNQTVTGGLYMEWNGTPEELTADGDSLHTDFPPTYSELIVLDTVIDLFDQEGAQENGAPKSILRKRANWEVNWLRYIDGRMTSSQHVIPFAPHFHDA